MGDEPATYTEVNLFSDAGADKIRTHMKEWFAKIADQARVREGEAYPWWGRMWRYNFYTDTKDVLPIPFCWLARILWKLWLQSFRVRCTEWEIELCRARQEGFAEGLGKKDQIHREVADDLFNRIQQLTQGAEDSPLMMDTERD